VTLRELGNALSKAIAKIRRATFVDRKLVKEVIRDIQRALLYADVEAKLVLGLSRRVEERALKEEVPPGFTRRDVVLKVVYEELVNLLGGEKVAKVDIEKGKPYVLMLVGIQGCGKTTSAAKIALFYKRRGYKVGLVCADNFRPAALEQLKQLASQIGVPVYGREGMDPVRIAKEGVEYFEREGCDLIIIDTAGRHKEERSLLREMKELAEEIKPSEVMLVLDSTMGKQAGPQAKAFNEATPIGSIMLTKLDGAAKGGGALAAVVATGAKIKFIGNGEKVGDLEPFEPPSFVNRLLGMGDLATLAKRVKESYALSKGAVERILKGELTLLDLKEQLLAMRKMGPLSKILESIPGYKRLTPENVKLGEEKIKKWLAALDSMTKEELLKPSIIDRSRIRRIARGAGIQVREVRELLSTYLRMKKYVRRLSRGDLRRLTKLLGQ